MTHTMSYATVQDNALHLMIEGLPKNRKSVFVLKTNEDWNYMSQELSDVPNMEIQCSSSIDFPEDHTKDKMVIEMCRRIVGII